MRRQRSRSYESGSIELVVLGLLAALIVVLAIPLLRDAGEGRIPAARRPAPLGVAQPS